MNLIGIMMQRSGIRDASRDGIHRMAPPVEVHVVISLHGLGEGEEPHHRQENQSGNVQSDHSQLSLTI